MSKIYHYNLNGVFTVVTEAKVDPLETKIQKKKIYQIPAYSTLKPIPKLKQNQTCIFKDDNWSIVKDYRNKKFYDKKTASIVYIQDVDIEPSLNLTLEIPSSEFPTWNEEKNKWEIDLDMFKQSYYENIKIYDLNNEMSKGFTIEVLEKTYFMDTSFINILHLKTGIEIAQLLNKNYIMIVDFYNKIHDNIPIKEAAKILEKLSEHYFAVWKKKNDYRQKILAAKSVDEVKKIIW